MIVVLDSHSFIPSNDRIALYGDGCFTTIAISDSKSELLNLHLTRLKSDCRRLHIDFLSWQELKSAITGLASSQNSAVIKVVVSRGQGGRGYSPAQCSEPTAYLSLSEIPAHYTNWRKNGISMSVSSVKLAIQPLLAGVKHLNRLEQVFIKHELDRTEYEDVLVCDTDGHVVESSAGNVFWRKNSNWFTPKLDKCGVEGVMRNQLLKLFRRKNIELKQRYSYVDDVFECDELLITNSLMRIVPVNCLQVRDRSKTWHRDDAQVASLQRDLMTEKAV